MAAILTPPVIERTPDKIEIPLVQGTTANCTISVRNTGEGTLAWKKSDDVPWITGLPAFGTSAGEWDRTTITIDAVGKTVGTHDGTITITAIGAAKTIPVTLTVTAAP